jgi:hypothetical protein
VSAVLNAARTGFAEIWAHKMRSALSFLAIAAGSVVFIESFAAIFHTYENLDRQKAISGIARVRISRNQAKAFSTPDDYTPPPSFTYEDVEALKKSIPGLFMVSPEGHDWHNVLEYDGQRLLTSFTGITPDWAKRDFVYSLKGRFIDWRDVGEKLRVCVLVKKAVPPPTTGYKKVLASRWDVTQKFDSLVAHGDMLGKLVKIDGLTFTVIGVLQELPASMSPYRLGDDEPYKVLAPVTTLIHYGIIGEDSNLSINIDAGDEAGFPEALRRITNFLRGRFGDPSYFLIENRLEEIRDIISREMSSALVTISLGMLAFIAGGIGIMNVTLATVFARTKEIGIRRAVGASRSDIMLQFIVEAVMLGLIGGLLGSALGWLWGVPGKVMLGMEPSPIRAWMPLVAVLIAAATAFAFAIYPAWVAAGLKPADALRAE